MALSQAWQAFIYQTTQDINWLTYSSKNDIDPKHENFKALGSIVTEIPGSKLKTIGPIKLLYTKTSRFLKVFYTVETIRDL